MNSCNISNKSPKSSVLLLPKCFISTASSNVYNISTSSSSLSSSFSILFITFYNDWSEVITKTFNGHLTVRVMLCSRSWNRYLKSRSAKTSSHCKLYQTQCWQKTSLCTILLSGHRTKKGTVPIKLHWRLQPQTEVSKDWTGQWTYAYLTGGQPTTHKPHPSTQHILTSDVTKQTLPLSRQPWKCRQYRCF